MQPINPGSDSRSGAALRPDHYKHLADEMAVIAAINPYIAVALTNLIHETKVQLSEKPEK
jgi:hypothetical protein